eukprot:6783449-Lingulodinium_polyedra.AAC.1
MERPWNGHGTAMEWPRHGHGMAMESMATNWPRNGHATKRKQRPLNDGPTATPCPKPDPTR